MSARIVVVDASAVAALVFGEKAAEEVAARLTGRRLAAPELLLAELANVATTKVRRKTLEPALVVKALADADSLGIELHRIPARAGLSAALQTGLTAYDAAYWLVARALSAELVTLDQALARAARVTH
jgi:predicted nucleic acid-binding protein